MHLEAGWLTGLKRVPSPYCDLRSDAELLSLLVIHNISLPPREFGGPYIDQLLTATLNPQEHPYFQDISHLRVSVHCLIRRDGGIVQYVPFDKRAWHAGVSQFAGCVRCNDFSIGIELEDTDTLPFTQEQYQQLACVARLLLNHYPITPQCITGHSDIAHQRKTPARPLTGSTITN